MSLDVRGKTVVLTGTFSRLKRAEAEAKLAALGAKIGGSVGKSTHMLFAGAKAGSKIEAAGRLGVAVHGEDELMALLAGETAEAAVGFAQVDGSLSGAALVKVIAGLPWDDFEASRDLPPLRAALYAHEAAHGVTAAHQAATEKLRPRALLGHAHGHDVEVGWVDLSPDGRFLATGSWIGDEYERGGVLQIWDVAAARCVNMLRIRGGVGWPDYDGCIQWRPDSRRVGLAFDTNGVGSFDPFAKLGEPESAAYVTDGWSRPPSWCWAPNSRDVYIACWGPDLELGAIVPLVARRPTPRWCAPVGRVDAKDPHSEPRLQPLTGLTWAHPDRIVGYNRRSQLFALDAKTGAIAWEQEAHPPVSFSPDGAEFAMHPAGIVYYDAAAGRPNGKLPMHLGAESLLYTRDGARLAAVVQPGNRWGAEPGVFIYDRGEYRYSLDVPAPTGEYNYRYCWHPDGSKAAITVGGRLQIWSLAAAPELVLDIPAPAGGRVIYGDGVLISYNSFALVFRRERDGAVIGEFSPAVEASGESPLLDDDGQDLGECYPWNPAFPLDRTRVAAAFPEGVVIGPGSVEEIDGKIAWVVDRKWAWPWRWGATKVWEEAAEACADAAAPPVLKRKYGKAKQAAKKSAKQAVKRPGWPPPGGALGEIADLLATGIKAIADGYHSGDVRRKYAVRTMALGMFERAAAAIESPEWPAWADPWVSALTRGETVLTALTGRISGAPKLAASETAVLRRWLTEGEDLLASVKQRALCRPQVMLGAGWLALGAVKRGEALVAAAVAGIDPEHNPGEHRCVVAEALAAIGRVSQAVEVLTGGASKVSWADSPPAIAGISARASAAELAELFRGMKAQGGHNEFVLLERGLTRLIELRAWDEAIAWIGGFEGLSTRTAEIRLATAMVAAGEPQRAEASLARGLKTQYASCAEYLLGLARVLPAAAMRHLEAIFAEAPRLLESGYYPLEFQRYLAGAAARLGRLDISAKVEALASSPAEAHAARLGVLAELDPAHPQWGEWLARARAEAPGLRDDAMQLAALAFRGGAKEASEELLDAAIEAARKESSADIRLMDVMAAMTAVDDLVGAHRAWMAISRGRRAHRNEPLMTACEQRGLWAAALEVLRQMPSDLNGAPQRASKLLLTAAGKEGW